MCRSHEVELLIQLGIIRAANQKESECPAGVIERGGHEAGAIGRPETNRQIAHGERVRRDPVPSGSARARRI